MAVTPAVGQVVLRDGYYVAGDAPVVEYIGSTSNCIAKDDGSQIQPTGIVGCWILQSTSVVDVREFGVVLGGANNGTTDNATRINQAIAYAGTIGTTNITTSSSQGPGAIVTSAGQMVGVEHSVNVKFVSNIEIDLDLEPSASGISWTAGSEQSASKYTAYYPSNGPPIAVNVWNPPDPFASYPSYVLPIGILNIGSTASNIIVNKPIISCTLPGATTPEPGCSAITQGGYLTTIIDPQITSFATYGIFFTAEMTVRGGFVTQGATSVGQSGYGLYCAGGMLTNRAADTLISGIVVYETYQDFYIDSACNDVHIDSSHPWNGAANNGKPITNAIIGTFHGGGSFNSNTTDNGEIILEASAGNLPNVTINGLSPLGGGGVFDGYVVFQCDQSIGILCGKAYSQLAPFPITSNLPDPSKLPGGGPQYDRYVLEDSNGNYNPGAWSDYVQQVVGGLNQANTLYTQPVNTVLQQTAYSFTGAINGSSSSPTFSITSTSILPAPGTTVTDTGSCIPPTGTTTLEAISYKAALRVCPGTYGLIT